MKTRNRSIARITTLLVGGITVAMVVLAPLAYFMVSYQYMLGSIDAQAEVSAALSAQLVRDNPRMWRYEEIRLMELMERRTRSGVPEVRRILDSHGNAVVKSADPLRWPLVTRRHAIHDAGFVVAYLEISRSLDMILLETALVAFVSLLIGLAVFAVSRSLPLKAIHQAEKFLEDSEKKYRSLYESMKEGMALLRLVCDMEGRPVSFEVADVNPVFETLTGVKKSWLVGKSGAEFLGGDLMGYFEEIVQAAETGETLEFELPASDGIGLYNLSIFFPDKEYFAVLLEDITERRRSEEQIQRLAYYDSLTGLPNRTLFQNRLEFALDVAERGGSRVALLYIDLDGFKNINDTLGHAQGDVFLDLVAKRLKGCVRRSDTLARLGGDEFIVLASFTGDSRNVAQFAQILLDGVSPAYEIAGREVYTSASIGISIYPDDGRDAVALMKFADLAMYSAKEAGRNGYCFYSHEMNRKVHARMEMETDLRRAMEREEFVLEFQPIIDVRRGCLVSAEALIRWDHPEHGRISPAEFIPVAEESGFVVPIGEWVLRKACEKMKEWRDAGLLPVKMSVNVSGRQFEQRNFIEVVQGILAETEIDPQSIYLELTETSLMKNTEAALETISSLKKLDLKIVVDDFGTGYSSLSYLKDFPIDRIKIDRSFVKDLSADEGDRSIVEAIIAMAGSLRLNIVAEGVETSEQRDLLLELGCSEMQGFLFHRPFSESAFVTFLQESRLCSIPV